MSGTYSVPMNTLLQYYLQQLSQQPVQDTDAPWVQNLKRLVQPNVDPRGEVQPANRNTDPYLNRTGPQVGDILST